MKQAINTPDLRDYDVILVNSSGGKDSQATLHVVTELAREAGVVDRLVVVHADLGRVEWQGTRDLVHAQAEFYGIDRVEVVSRPQGDLLEHVESRGKWPSSTARYCTSDHKRGQCAKVVTKLVAEAREANGGQVVNVLNVFGFRAQESTARAKREPFARDDRLSNTKREVTAWLPIHDWTEVEVWTAIGASGAPYHPAYDLGMPRLSCVFCIFAGEDALTIAGRANPELLQEYARVERSIGHTFKKGWSIADLADRLEDEDPVSIVDGLEAFLVA